MAKQNVLTRSKKKKAISLFQNQQFEQAKELLVYICNRDKKDFESFFMLGTINAQSGLLSEAESFLLSAVNINNKFYPAYDSLGAVLHQQGKKDDAIKMFKKSILIEPGNYASHYNLGNALKENGNYAEAMESYKKSIALKSDFFNAYNNIGTIHLRNKAYIDAAENFQKSIQINPDEPGLYTNIFKAFLQLGKLVEAEAAISKSLELDPTNSETHFELGKLHSEQGYFKKVEDDCREAIRLNPGYIEANNLLGVALLTQGKLDEAKLLYEELQIKEPNSIQAAEGLASIEIKKGNYDQAYKYLYSLLKNKMLSPHSAFLLGSISKHTHAQDEAAEQMEELLKNEPLLSLDSKKHLHYGLGSLYDEIHEYEKAFQHYQKANELQPYEFDSQQLLEATNELISTVQADLLANAPRASNTIKPIFIVGMMRSGTSLVEQIISSHPQVYGAGELETVTDIVTSLTRNIEHKKAYPYCLKSMDESTLNNLSKLYTENIRKISNGAEFITDKLPHNFWHLALIELLFPEAKIIICNRNPLDICLSNYFQDFAGRHPHSNNIQHLGEYYIQYVRLIQHWKNTINLSILEVQYEDLVANQEDVSKKIIDFCGLEWDQNCLQFHKSNRIVLTASSDQVKQPIYKKSVNRWNNYEKYLSKVMKTFDANNITY